MFDQSTFDSDPNKRRKVINHSNYLDKKDKDGNTALHLLCKEENLNFEEIKRLIESKCQMNLKDHKFDTPMHLILENEKVNFDSVKYFVEEKSNLNKINSNG